VVLAVQAVDASTAAAVAAGSAAFAGVFGALFRMQWRAVDAMRATASRFPSPPAGP
jgi:hypothetical protein